MTIWCRGLGAEWNVNNKAKILRIEIIAFARLKPAVKSETVEWNLY